MTIVTVEVNRSAQQGRRPRWATVLGGCGEVLITLGVVVLLLVIYELWITGIFTREAQHKLENQLQQSWSAPAAPEPAATTAPEPAPDFGSGIAILHAVAMGKTWKWVVVEGVGAGDLAKGPGHYPGTAEPGGLGNFVVSGHRTTHGAPFYNADKLETGDAIVVETRDTWYVYRVTTEQVVLPSAVGVVLPVPDKPGVAPTQRLITLTTCDPKYSASHRLIVHGVLAEVEAKSEGRPAALITGRA